MRDPESSDQIDQDLVTALGHPLRVRILQILNEREASPSELMTVLRKPLGNVAYHTNVLAECGCVELVGTKQRRGAVEHFFRAVPRSYIGHQSWRKVPRSLRGNVTATALEAFMGRAVAALEAGKIDDRDDSTLNWMTLAVDEAGWVRTTEILDAAIFQLQAVHEESRERLAASEQPATSIIVALAAFEAASRNGGAGGGEAAPAARPARAAARREGV